MSPARWGQTKKMFAPPDKMRVFEKHCLTIATSDLEAVKQLERRRVDQHLPARRLRFVRVDERRPDDEALLAPEVRDLRTPVNNFE